ncbi:MAG: hypothetical protein KKA16_14785 [Alphaproteobacteria bacterium]|uniref:Uncharacterized protein n=1 Tax=viral metagenome TaxID=1070528 RepID=A0A6H1ZJ08_9ZZZZ|nr:hypothetical protein [Alphaproteobacteria bacterium]MBU2379195.1 hypothetical protein [Alphaproteobacteria bacterium]
MMARAYVPSCEEPRETCATPDQPAHAVRRALAALEAILTTAETSDRPIDILALHRIADDLAGFCAQESAEASSADLAVTRRLAAGLDNLELVQIGLQLDRLFPELMRRIGVQGDRIAAAHDAAHRENPDWSVLRIPDRSAVIRRHEDAQGVYALDVDPELTSFRLIALSDRASTLRATSMAALRTKARLVSWREGPFKDMSVLASLLADLGGDGADEAADASPT